MSSEELNKILKSEITHGNYDALEMLRAIIADADLQSDISSVAAQQRKSDVEAYNNYLSETNKESALDIENRLLRSLTFKYNNIPYAPYSDTRTKKLAVVQILQSFRKAFKLYQNPLFLEVIYTELTGSSRLSSNNNKNLVENKAYFKDWFTLDLKGQMVNNLTTELNINLVEDLYFVLEQLNIAHKTTIVEDIRRQLARDIAQKQLHIYNQLFKSKIITGQDRKTVAKCLSNLVMCYEIAHEPAFLQTAANELSGKMLFNWFDFSEKGDFEAHANTLELLDFSPTLLMKRIMYHLFSKDVDNNLIRQEIQTNVYNRIHRDMIHELAEVEQKVRHFDRNNFFIHLIKRCENGYYNFDKKDETILNLARGVLTNEDFINRLFYLKMTYSIADEIDTVKLWLGKMPPMKPEFLQLIVDTEKAEAYQVPTLFAPQRQEIREEFSPIYPFLFGSTSLMLYIVTLIFLTYSIANEYYFVELRDLRALLGLNFLMIFMSIYFGHKSKVPVEV
jgi:hypothetical protein